MPNWYGIPEIGFEWRGAWNEPLLHYKGQVFYSSDIEDALYENYAEDGGNLDNHDEWTSYVKDNAVNYLEDIINATEGE